MNSTNISTLKSTVITFSQSSLKSRINNVFDFNELDEIGELIKDTRKMLKKAKISPHQAEINQEFLLTSFFFQKKIPRLGITKDLTILKSNFHSYYDTSI